MDRLVVKGRFKVLIRDGEIDKLELDGEVYEGLGNTVPIPLGKVKDVKLSEIPKEVLIEPVETISGREGGSVITLLSYGKLSYEVSFGNGYAHVEILERRKLWEGYIGLDAYVDALERVLNLLERKGVVVDHYSLWDNDYYTCYYEIPLNANLTVGEAVTVVKRVISLVENAMDRLVGEALRPLVHEMLEKPRPEDIVDSLRESLGLS